MSGAAAYFEDARFGRKPDHSPDKRFKNPPPGHEPPMNLIEFGHSVEDGAFHTLHKPPVLAGLSAAKEVKVS
jgi:hypothetical protein